MTPSRILHSLRKYAAPSLAGLLLSGSREEGPLVGGVRPESFPAGRGRLVTRARGIALVQTAWCAP